MKGWPGRFTILAGVCGVWVLLCLLNGCGMGGQERSGVGKVMTPPPSSSVQAASADPYELDPIPLTVADCGRCHGFHFQRIRENGGGHRIDCRECHQQFHAYNPIRENFAELMPQCGQCHTNPHIDKYSSCLSCHEQPHAPRQIPFSEPFVSACGDCHQEQGSQLQQFPCAHSAQECQTCHSERHGRILSCLECHDVHYATQPLSDCARCHPAHKPLDTDFSPDDAAATCKDCHEGVLRKLQSTASKHGQLNCTECHLTHRVVPGCSECHSAPHDASFLTKFPDCLACHLDAHDLPVK